MGEGVRTQILQSLLYNREMLYGKKYGGTDPQLIEGDNFRMVISVPEFGENPTRTTKIISTQQVTQQVKRPIAVSIGELSRAELMQALGIKDRVSFSRNYIEPALKYNLLEMTQPDSPKSPTQKYRLTDKGRKIFKKMDKL